MSSVDVFAIVLAGGAGTRLWPASRSCRPKFLLPFTGRVSLLEHTLDRAKLLAPIDQIVVVSNPDHLEETRSVAARAGVEWVISEPARRDTAPALMLANSVILARSPGARVVSLAADHWVSDSEGWASTMSAALRCCTSKNLVIVGATPTRAETGYGYVRTRADAGTNRVVGQVSALPVLKFIEKPGVETARRLSTEPGWFWNTAIMCWRTDTFASMCESVVPGEYSLVQDFLNLMKNGDEGAAKDLWCSLPSIAVDYALLEPLGDRGSVVLVPAGFQWEDVGTWLSFFRNGGGMVDSSRVVEFESANVNVFADPDGPVKKFVFVGVDEVSLVDTGDVIMVMANDMSQRMKEVAAEIGRHGWSDLL